MERMSQLAGQLDEATLRVMSELETDTMADLYTRMADACQRKCLRPAESPALPKQEAVCVDRCVAKFLELHERLGRKLTSIQLKDEKLISLMQPEQFIRAKVFDPEPQPASGQAEPAATAPEVAPTAP